MTQGARRPRGWQRRSRRTCGTWRCRLPDSRSSSATSLPATTWCSSSGRIPASLLCRFSKVASGGELARAMLALRLVVAGGRPTLVFDEVDAGIGGAAADAVGRALAELAAHHQVLVVTHLPQVAAFAHHQFVVEKQVHLGRTRAVGPSPRSPDERVVELARMLSGRPASSSARRHAEELLADAAKVRVAPAAMD